MNCEVSGRFAHTPEPIPENLVDLCSRVKEEKADLGIAVDPDGDRLVLITEKGEPYGEEYTIASAIEFVLTRHSNGKRENLPGGRTPRVVINLSTTRAAEDIARMHGAEVIRTPVGEINVAKRMKEVGALIGGEGSGGVIFPSVHLGRDAVAGIPLVLQLLAERGGTLSDLKASLPQYFICKGKVGVEGLSPDAVLDQIRKSHQTAARVNTEDGLRLDFSDSWVHLRKSNTEPILRIIAEAGTAAEAASVVERFKTLVAVMKT
jgi:phosphomannomutase